MLSLANGTNIRAGWHACPYDSDLTDEVLAAPFSYIMILHTLNISVNFVSFNVNASMYSIVRNTEAAACTRCSKVCLNFSENAALIRIKLK